MSPSQDLQHEQLTALESEVYLEQAINKSLPANGWPPLTGKPLLTLAEALEANQHDSWFSDFLKAPSSIASASLFRSALRSNRQGDPQKAEKEARQARDLFNRLGNRAGAARSQIEIIYSLHRQSRPEECLKEAHRLSSMSDGRHYHWIDIQLLLESSSCQGMLTHFDPAWHLATEAVSLARSSKYPVLALRATGFQASLHTVEGRLMESWQSNIAGLNEFWNGAFVNDRGFQFYSDLELAAEKSSEWHLAVGLQRETLKMLEGTERLDIAAIAHFRLAGVLETVGDYAGSKSELTVASDLFRRLPSTTSTELYKAYSEISLATSELRRGEPELASAQLAQVNSNIQEWNNFNVQLRFFKAAAEIARYKHDPQEGAILAKVVALGDQGFKALRSEEDRRDWDHEIGPAYRRLLELEMQEPHASEQALADWELYRSKQISGMSASLGSPVQNAAALRTLHRRLRRLTNSTLISFALFPDSITAWIADDRGTKEFVTRIDYAQLRSEVTNFYYLCANPHSPIEKVKASATRLYSLLLGPVEADLNPNRELLIEADDVLGLTPWPALMMENGSYLGDSYTISQSLGVFSSNLNSAEIGNPYVVVADPGPVKFEGQLYPPLPQAAAEAAAIAKMYSRSRLLSGESVTIKNLSRELPHASLFHFAGHATSWQHGGELLIPRGDNADILSANYVSTLNLANTRMVVLSACSTAAGDQDLTSGPYGLVSAFLHAGSRKVLATRWNIDSLASASLVLHFYSLIGKKQTAAYALGSARKAVAEQPLTAHPYYWAAYELFESTR